MPKRLMAFVASARPEASLAFYRDVLGLPLLADTPFALVFDAFGVALRVQKVPQVAAAAHTVLGFGVDDIAHEVRALGERGVSFERYPYFEQDELGIWTAPGGARVAWFRDPDGNLLSLTEEPA